jgi:hypothetical protein
MDFELSEALANRLLNRIAGNSPLARQLGEHGVMVGRTIVSSALFDEDALGVLADCCREQGNRSLMLQVSALRHILGDPETRKIGKLEVLVPGLIAYLSQGVIDGWLYRRHKDGVFLPWLVYNIRLMNPVEPAKPYVVLDLIANTMRSTDAEAMEDSRNRRSDMTNAIVIYPHDIVNKTIPEVLADQGYFKENQELKLEYESHAQRFLQLQPQFGKQFLVKNAGFLLRDRRRFEFVKLKDGVSAKCVNDEETLDRQFEMRASSEFWCENGIWSGFEKIPLHCYVYMFHLELHEHIWVHVQNVEEYRYKPELREKLVLPDAHRDLIDILTTDMNTLMEDIVEGKSGGTTILCKGVPGLGKTLTAEVYAEVVGKPLYRVHSGQLGITAASVQASLTEILRRAARWDSILLLDEADVYIRQRDNDLQHNAIVAEFLRTLEYFSGLLFMTTNRTDDVDDAILSRCIAIIHYELPQKSDAVRLWKSLAGQFKVDLPDALIEELVTAFPLATGRDIKELLKLTSKYCKIKRVPFSLQAFQQCAVFRGIS